MFKILYIKSGTSHAMGWPPTVACCEFSYAEVQCWCKQLHAVFFPGALLALPVQY